MCASLTALYVAMNEEKFGGGTVKAFCFFLERGISEVDDDTNI